MRKPSSHKRIDLTPIKRWVQRRRES
jgi:hypothetical protein